MPDNNHERPLGKEPAIVIAIAVFLILVTVGGLAMQHGYFDGTVMRELFPAMILGYLTAFSVVLGVAFFFPNAIPAWIISGIVSFAIMVPIHLWADELGLRRESRIGALILAVILVILYLVQWILRRIK